MPRITSKTIHRETVSTVFTADELLDVLNLTSGHREVISITYRKDAGELTVVTQLWYDDQDCVLRWPDGIVGSDS